MKPHTTHFPLTRQLFCTVTLCIAANSALAQVNVINKPYRAATPVAPTVATAPMPDLGIAPYQQQYQAPYAPPATPQPYMTPYRPEQLGYWDVLLTDGTLHKALMRWSRADGRPVHWEAPMEIPAISMRYTGTYLEAFKKLMDDSESTVYKLHACEHDNVIRVLHSSQACKH